MPPSRVILTPAQASYLAATLRSMAVAAEPGEVVIIETTDAGDYAHLAIKRNGVLHSEEWLPVLS